MKTCTKCGLEKPETDFRLRNKKTGNRRSECIHCYNARNVLYRKEHNEKISKRKSAHYYENKERIIGELKKYYQENKEHIKAKRRGRYNTNEARVYRQNNKSHINNVKRENRASNPHIRIRENVSGSVRRFLKSVGSSKSYSSILKHLPYSIKELKEHLENQFESWMTWENYGRYNTTTWNDNEPTTWTWQVDHIIPQSILPYTSMTDDNFKLCWALSNLRPYSAKLNIKEGNRR